MLGLYTKTKNAQRFKRHSLPEKQKKKMIKVFFVNSVPYPTQRTGGDTDILRCVNTLVDDILLGQ